MEKKCLHLILIFLFTVTKTIGEESLTCPSGDQSAKKCDNYHRCDDNQFCRRLKAGTFRCCNDKSFCKETGMLTFYSLTPPLTLWTWDEHSTNNQASFYYKKTLQLNGDNIVAACPKPLSVQLVEYGAEGLPVNFEPNGNPLTPCTKSTECGQHSFCSYVYNPSFCDHNEIKKFRNQCVDRDISGKQSMFCYKLPLSGMDNIQVKTKKSIGFDICSTVRDCLRKFPNEKVFCKHGKNKFKEIDVNGKPTGKEKEGICVEATVCSKHRHSSTLGSLGIDGKECELEKPETCPGQNVECIAASSSLDYSNFCCQIMQSTTTKATTTAIQTTTSTTSTKHETAAIGTVVPTMKTNVVRTKHWERLCTIIGTVHYMLFSV